MTPEIVAEVISWSIHYIDNAEELEALLRRYRDADEVDKKALAIAAAMKFPGLDTIHRKTLPDLISRMIQIAGYHLLSFHLAPRISEVLSACVGFVGIHDGKDVMFRDRITLVLTTVKAVESEFGLQRYFPVHPYLRRVAHVLQRFKALNNTEHPYIFFNPTQGNEWTHETFKHAVHVFNKRHSISFNLTLHGWRKTVVALTTLSTKNSLEPLRELLGHKAVGEALGYALSSPFVKRELEKAIRAVTTEAFEDIVGASLTLGGEGLGGPQGKALEQKLARSKAPKKGKRAQEKLRDDVIKKSMELGIVPLQVDDSQWCLKESFRRGLCSISSGDTLPDIERCHPKCQFRIEGAIRREQLRNKIATAPAWLGVGTSILETMRQARDILDNLIGWPELKPDFDLMLANNPSLKRFFAL